MGDFDKDATVLMHEVCFASGRVSAPRRDVLADDIAALANGNGGTCWLGFDAESGEVIGIPIDSLDKVMDRVVSACETTVQPPIFPSIEKCWMPSTRGEQQPVIKVDVPRSPFVHKSPGGYLHRIGSFKREMSPEYLARQFQRRGQARIIRFDEQRVPGVALDDLVPELWQRFQTGRSRDPRDDLLVKLGMARCEEDGALRPTVAGVLMATNDPRNWIPNAFVQAVAYRGIGAVPQSGTDGYQLDAADISGPLDKQIVDACRFVMRNMRVPATKDMGRRDIPQFDMPAVFEAVVNAVAHRDYSIHGSKIRLRLFADRLELYSPGAILNTMTVESLPYRQATRNEVITSLLAKCPIPAGEGWLQTDRQTLMDKRGEGVQIILDNSERLSQRRPEYQLIDEAELLLVIHAAEPQSQ